MTEGPARPDRPSGWQIPLGVAAGAGIGLIFGILLDMLATGITFGAAIGLVVGAITTGVADTPPARRGRVVAAAIGIAVAGAAVILALLSR